MFLAIHICNVISDWNSLYGKQRMSHSLHRHLNWFEKESERKKEVKIEYKANRDCSPTVSGFFWHLPGFFQIYDLRYCHSWRKVIIAIYNIRTLRTFLFELVNKIFEDLLQMRLIDSNILIPFFFYSKKSNNRLSIGKP